MQRVGFRRYPCNNNNNNNINITSAAAVSQPIGIYFTLNTTMARFHTAMTIYKETDLRDPYLWQGIVT